MVKVYFSNISKLKLLKNKIDTLPNVRKIYVDNITDLTRKKQSLYVWLLLEYAVNLNYANFSISYSQNNGVFCEQTNRFNFSLSHSSDIVAVAISDKLVGVDVEKCSNKILRLKNKPEFINCSNIEELTLQWTKKESLFKCKEGNNFYYKNIIDEVDNKYFLTVCTNCDRAEFIEVNPKYL